MADQLQFPADLLDYLRQVSLRDDEILRELREETAELPAGRVLQVSPEEGQFLGLLAGLTGARSVLEVGTYTGYSTLCLARALPAGGTVVTCDITDKWPDIGAAYWQRAGVADRIDVRIGDAADTLEKLLADAPVPGFDLVFLDADKASYPRYYELVLQLVRPGGLIVADNTLFFGRVIDPEHRDPDTAGIRAFNTLVRDDDRVDLSLIPFADGITLIRRRG